MRYYVNVDGQDFEVDVTQEPGRAPVARLVGDANVDLDGAELEMRDAYEYVLRKDGRRVEIFCDDLRKRAHLTIRGSFKDGPVRSVARVESAQQRAAASVTSHGHRSHAGVVTSPMPGKVAKVLASVGQLVRAGEPVMIVEAMKMENELLSDVDGTVSAVHAAVGATVEARVPLVEIAGKK